MSDLTEFLLARIEDDEREARAVIAEFATSGTVLRGSGASPERLLAECDAKRRIVERLAAEVEQFEHPRPGVTYNPHGNLYILGLEVACRELAAVHADHPDYHEEWKL